MHVGPIPFELYLAFEVVLLTVVGAIPFVLPGNQRIFPFAFGFLAVLFASTVPVTRELVSFGGIHVLYAALTCALPAIGVVALISIGLKRRTDHPRVYAVLAIACLVPGTLGYYATNIEPKQLDVDHFQLGSGDKHVRVVVLSDIQSPGVGAFEKRVAKTASAQNADLILYAGDLYSGEDNPFPRHFQAFVDLARNLDAPDGTFFVPGDHDGDDDLPSVVHAAGKTFMQEDEQIIDVHGIRVGIVGLDTDFTTENATALMNNLASRNDLDYKIVLDHKPDVIFRTPPGIDLVVAGHTHGGQVNVPLFGPVMTLSNIPRNQAAGGLFNYSNGRKLFVSRGIGVEHGGAPIVRFNDKPQVAVLDLHFS